jgi:molecular chaperone GrpE
MADKHPFDPAHAPVATDPSGDPSAGRDAPEAGSGDALEAVTRERDDYYDRLLRKTAEFDNYRKRIERERREQADQAVTGLLEELLSVVDDFERARQVEPGEGGAAYRKGVELIYDKLLDMLRRRGVKPIEALGADFDPTLHEAVIHEESPGARDGEVIGELRRGYTIGGQLLRPAMVKVAKA